MIEHCISALKSNTEEKSLKIYITDALMAIADNTTHLVGHTGVVDYGRRLNTRWIELLDSKPEPPEDDRPSEEIASDIWERIRGH